MKTMIKVGRKAAWTAVVSAMLWGGLVLASSANLTSGDPGARAAYDMSIMAGDSVAP